MPLIESNMIVFPSKPTAGQEFLADNGVTYIWMGNRWSATQAILTGQAQYTIDGLYAGSEYNPLIDATIDGGLSN